MDITECARVTKSRRSVCNFHVISLFHIKLTAGKIPSAEMTTYSILLGPKHGR